jgi:hypothetical protein
MMCVTGFLDGLIWWNHGNLILLQPNVLFVLERKVFPYKLRILISFSASVLWWEDISRWIMLLSRNWSLAYEEPLINVTSLRCFIAKTIRVEINGYIFYIKVTWELFLEVNTSVIDKKKKLWASNVSQSSCPKDSVFFLVTDGGQYCPRIWRWKFLYQEWSSE